MEYKKIFHSFTEKSLPLLLLLSFYIDDHSRYLMYNRETNKKNWNIRQNDYNPIQLIKNTQLYYV